MFILRKVGNFYALCQQTELNLKASGRNGLLGPDIFTKDVWLEK
jgi:hypothetical protein